MGWLDLVFKGVSAIVSQWLVASAEERAAIEARALKAVEDMVGDRDATGKAHDERTANTLAEIEKARAALDKP